MKVLITAGPTQEPIDPVRYITNRSSGKMGYALAEAARDAGHEVVLISGPVQLEVPSGVSLIAVTTAAEMFEAVKEAISNCDAAIFCAAVADYRIAEEAKEKIKKSGEKLTLELVKNPDILGSARGEFGFSGLLIGFAAETNDVEAHAKDKLERKGCDLLVANDVSRKDIGFDQDENEVVVYSAEGEKEVLPRASKREIANQLIAMIEERRRSE